MGTKFEGSKREIRALNAFIPLMRAADTVSDFAHDHLKDHGLTVSQFGALEALFHCGEMCQGDLALKMMRTLGSITSVVDGLQKRRLVRRERAAEDKRFVNVKLTEAGRRLVERILPTHVKLVTERFSAISGPQQEELRRICRQLGKGRD
jgi:MarR family transcriptional regulator, 2-MHQ and catechol-resistance regulon repressor